MTDMLVSNRRRGTLDAVAISAARSACRVLTTVFTSIKTTGRRLFPLVSVVVTRVPGGRTRDDDHLA